MAQAGYKEGKVTLSGIKDGKRTTIRTGDRATRGSVQAIRDFARGMAANAKAKETRAAIAAIIAEADRLAKMPTPPGSRSPVSETDAQR
jgi:hypothetical protein